MGFFQRFRGPDIHQGVKECADNPDAVLLDVRTPQEHRDGHIPGSQNLPLQTIDMIEEVADNRDTPIYVYCHSGVRSSQAAAHLEELGYTNVKDLGGIIAWSGKVAR